MIPTLLLAGVTFSLLYWLNLTLEERFCDLSFWNKEAEEEKKDTAFESVRGTPNALGSDAVGTRMTEKMRWATTRVSWSGWTIAKSSWWNNASGNAYGGK